MFKINSELPYLNIGCGSRFNESWTNLDFISSGKNVIAFNLLKGIPFENNSFELVYHSHVLEHFSKKDGEKLIGECNRVLKKNGIVRIAIPDLERIAIEYLKNLELALNGNKEAAYNYEWIKLEMYDQTVRNKSGGEMLEYLRQQSIPNKEYIIERIGREAEGIIDTLANGQVHRDTPSFKNNLKYLLSNLKNKFKSKEKELGKFRLQGEIHQWMYDRFSIKVLLENNGFENVVIRDAFTSYEKNWSTYLLDSNNKAQINKPDSLFIEALKK